MRAFLVSQSLYAITRNWAVGPTRTHICALLSSLLADTANNTIPFLVWHSRTIHRDIVFRTPQRRGMHSPFGWFLDVYDGAMAFQMRCMGAGGCDGTGLRGNITVNRWGAMVNEIGVGPLNVPSMAMGSAWRLVMRTLRAR